MSQAKVSPSRRTERLDARITQQEKEIIQTAAHLRGTSITDFVVMSAKEVAARIIRENESLTLSRQSREVFVDALLNPPRPNERALTAARRLKREIG